LLYTHIQQHVNFLARQQVLEGAQNAISQARTAVQNGMADPALIEQQIAMTEQALSNEKDLEDYVALIQAQILEKLLPEMVPPAPDPAADPLVQIRQAELQLDQQDMLQKAQNDQNKLALEMAKLQQKAAGEAARLELQEEIADERNMVNRERINVQRQAVLNRGG